MQRHIQTVSSRTHKPCAPTLSESSATRLAALAPRLTPHLWPRLCMPPGEAPAWVYVLTALSVVAYVNLDCMDGKQARRTGSSSPLGQVNRNA